jgi:hypothetical protein
MLISVISGQGADRNRAAYLPTRHGWCLRVGIRAGAAGL